MRFNVIHNGWPNQATWMLARWLGAKRYSYLIKITGAAWNKYRGSSDRSALARIDVASRIEGDVRAGVEAAELFKSRANGLLREVGWHRVADCSLTRFREYECLFDR